MAAVLGVAGALALGAGSASAADAPPPMPAGQSLYNIDCDNHGPQLWSFTPDGASTPVGTPGIGGDDCAGGAQTDQVTGVTYFVYYDNTSSVTSLATVNLTTGAVAIVAPISGDTDDAWQLMITNAGKAYVTDDSNLYGLALDSGVTTLIGDMGPVNPGAVGYDPVNDTIYAFNRTATMTIYTVDPATAVATDISVDSNWPVSTTCFFGVNFTPRPDNVVFDGNGIAWIQSDNCDSVVLAYNPATNEAWNMGELFDATATLYPVAPHDYYSETFIVGGLTVPEPAPAPALAKTGLDYTAAGTVGAGAAALSLAGIALLAARRRSRA